MTAQISELILVDEKWYGFGDVNLPLDPLLEQQRLRLHSDISACWRGYRARWQLEGSRLYLVAFDGIGIHLDGGKHVLEETKAREEGTGREVTAETLFPGQALPVFAKWWSGDITCRFGEVLAYKHMGFASIYEFERKLTFVAGILVADETIRHTMEELEEAARAAASKKSLWTRLTRAFRR